MFAILVGSNKGEIRKFAEGFAETPTFSSKRPREASGYADASGKWQHHAMAGTANHGKPQAFRHYSIAAKGASAAHRSSKSDDERADLNHSAMTLHYNAEKHAPTSAAKAYHAKEYKRHAAEDDYHNRKWDAAGHGYPEDANPPKKKAANEIKSSRKPDPVRRGQSLLSKHAESGFDRVIEPPPIHMHNRAKRASKPRMPKPKADGFAEDVDWDRLFGGNKVQHSEFAELFREFAEWHIRHGPRGGKIYVSDTGKEQRHEPKGMKGIGAAMGQARKPAPVSRSKAKAKPQSSAARVTKEKKPASRRGSNLENARLEKAMQSQHKSIGKHARQSNEERIAAAKRENTGFRGRGAESGPRKTEEVRRKQVAGLAPAQDERKHVDRGEEIRHRREEEIRHRSGDERKGRGGEELKARRRGEAFEPRHHADELTGDARWRSTFDEFAEYTGGWEDGHSPEKHISMYHADRQKALGASRDAINHSQKAKTPQQHEHAAGMNHVAATRHYNARNQAVAAAKKNPKHRDALMARADWHFGRIMDYNNKADVHSKKAGVTPHYRGSTPG